MSDNNETETENDEIKLTNRSILIHFIVKSNLCRMSFMSERNTEIRNANPKKYEVFKWNPVGKSKLYQYTMYWPMNTIHYFRNLSKSFGWKYVTIIMVVYGIQQGDKILI